MKWNTVGKIVINIALAYVRIDILEMVWLSGCRILFSQEMQATVIKNGDRSKPIDFEIVQEISHLVTPELQKSVFTECLFICIKKFRDKTNRSKSTEFAKNLPS